MIFTSYTYLLFLAVVFLAHWHLPARWRKLFLVLASYGFYMSWSWPFGFLLLGVSVFNWAYGRWVLTERRSVLRLAAGIAANLSPLIYFKYTGFILDSAAVVGGWLGHAWHFRIGEILLPLGISFFTFQGIAYLVDVTGGEKPLESPLDFFLFKALWPQLIAGPIVRLSEMRGQIQGERTLEYGDFSQGCRRILFGFFKKVVLADALAPVVEMVFLSKAAPHVVDVTAGILGFGMQIYFDFSAYSDIAIGSARLFGFRLPENFYWPYGASSPQEFWNRWHQTLSRWIRDYLFIPLSFSYRRRPGLAPLWILIAMAVCGLWHGAAWTFVVWGVWHGALLVLNATRLKGFFAVSRGPSSLGERLRVVASTAVTFFLMQIGWLFFRAGSIEQALTFLKSLLTFHGGFRPSVLRENDVLFTVLVFGGMMAAHFVRFRCFPDVGAVFAKPWARFAKPLVYALVILSIVVFDQEAKPFVYFQF
ncbi:MAG: MBOAT family protein [Candidatus Omnitrophica bacterium]|nr:MBOAT family protein [Candidatus Omnitrophota bacterium]